MKLTAELVEGRNDLGIVSGQMRGDDFVHNGGWYNAEGEKIGWGDLSKEDLERIVKHMAGELTEVFVVMGEHDSFWPFVTSLGPLGALCETDATEKNPGLDYVAEKARYVITGNGIFHFHSDEEWEVGSLTVLPMTRTRLRQLLG